MQELELWCFGRFEAALGGQRLRGFDSYKSRALVAYLVLTAETVHTRDHLAALLWGEKTDTAARASLRQALLILQRITHNQTAMPPYFLVTRETVQFNRESNYSCDVHAFEQLLAETETHAHRKLETCPACERRLTRAVELYRGGLLEHFFVPDSPTFDEWLLVPRAALQQRAVEALTHLIEIQQCKSTPDLEAIRAYTERILELEPWREEPHRMLMELYAAQGDFDAVLAQFETCRRLLAEQMGVEPSLETVALLKRLRDGDKEIAKRKDGERREADVHPIAPSLYPSIPPSPSSLPFSLPHVLTPFVGRKQELRQITEWLAEPHCRLVTLVGPGGIGKSRLALEAAHQQRGNFGGGVLFVPLVDVPTATQVPAAVLDALGAQRLPQQEPRTQLLQWLNALQDDALLVLDNFEHLGADTTLVAEMLDVSPHVNFLVTSRERLHLEGEWLMDVAGLPLPPEGAEPKTLEAYDAPRLFLQTAMRVSGRGEPALSIEDKRAVHLICRWVEGMPLGIELAAAWTRYLAPQEIAAEMQSYLERPVIGPEGGVSERHVSLRSVFEYSWQFLSEHERSVYPRLAVFRGGFERRAAQEVAQADLSTLAGLMDKSLVRRSVKGRYDLHPVLRQFAGERQTEAEDTAQRHAVYYLGHVRRLAPKLNHAEAQSALAALHDELENIRTAWQHVVATSNREELTQALPGVTQFYDASGMHLELEQLIEQAGLRFAQGEDSAMRAHLDAYRADSLVRLGRYDAAKAAAAQAVSGADSLAVMDARVRGQYAWGLALTWQGEYQAGRIHFDEAYQVATAHALDAQRALVCMGLGLNAYLAGNFQEDLAFVEQALEIAVQLGDLRLESRALQDLADSLTGRDEYERAHPLLERALALKREIGEPHGELRVLLILSRTVGLYRRNYTEALALLDQAYEIAQRIGDPAGRMLVLSSRGEILRELKQYDEARTVMRMVLELAEQLAHVFAQVNGRIILATIALADQQPIEARHWIREALDLADKWNMPGLKNVALELEAKVQTI